MEVREEPLPWAPHWLVGVDVAYGVTRAFAGVAAYDLEKASVAASWVVPGVPPWPYRPGFFFLREAPLVLAALKGLPKRSVVVLHGHGRAHPLRAGLASVVGVLLELPTIGCAGSLLCGEATEPGAAAGSWSPIWWEKRRVGAWVRTKAGVKPVVVSVGHGIRLQEAVHLVSTASVYRLPQPLREADRLARQVMRSCGG